MILLYGHGYIGYHIAEELTKQGFKFVHRSHDRTPIAGGYTFIINAAGYTGVPNVDTCEKYKDECVDGNIMWPLKLERNNHIPILHISSGCVYTGYEKKWTEEDKPNFTFNNASFYSACKSLSQELITPYLYKSYLFRIRMPFGSNPHPKNLLTKYMSYDKLVDFENSVTRVEDLAKCVCYFIQARPKFGIYNVCNPGSTTTKKIVDKMGIQKEWMTHEEFAKAVVAPRSNCVLDTDKLASVYKMPLVDDALDDAIGIYRNMIV
jgi:dTDP-4-dehydrorhamnose reductase